jgi:rubrerythrin
MGHSTVSIKKDGMLSEREILAAVRAKKDEDSAEYGYSENPDSFAHAGEPSMKFLRKVYSSNAVREIIAREVNDYNSFAFYYVDQKTWNETFRSSKQEKAIEKSKAKLVKLQSELEDFITLSLKESGLEEIKKSSAPDPEPKFWTCEHCKSKVNMRMHYRICRSLPERCPVCAHPEAEMVTVWRQKLIGKTYAQKRTKLEKAIEDVKLELKSVQTDEVTSIDVSDVAKHKGLLAAVRTLIAADIHH